MSHLWEEPALSFPSLRTFSVFFAFRFWPLCQHFLTLGKSEDDDTPDEVAKYDHSFCVSLSHIELRYRCIKPLLFSQAKDGLKREQRMACNLRLMWRERKATKKEAV